MNTEPLRRSGNAGVALAAAALVAYAATAAMVPLDNNDVWIHLTTGRLILEEGAVPRSDVYSFTAAGNRYVAHEWLAAVMYAAAERAGGIPAVEWVGKILPALVLVAALGFAVRAAGLPAAMALPVALLPLTLLRARMLARPELLVLPLLLIVLALLWRDRSSARRGERTLALFWLVPIAAVWANVHGSYPLGIVLVLVFAFAEAADQLLTGPRAGITRGLGMAAGLAGAAWLATLEPRAFGIPAAFLVLGGTLLFAWRGDPPLFRAPPAAATGGQGVLRLLGIAAAMAVAVALNPRGPEIYTFPYEFTATLNVITETVNEWQPVLDSGYLDDSLHRMAFASYLAVWFAALALAARRGRLGRLELALFLAFAVLPLRHLRWIPLMALVTMPALVSTLVAARTKSDTRVAPGLSAGLSALAIACLALACVDVWRAPADLWLRVAWLLSSGAAAVALWMAWRPETQATVGVAAAGGAAFLLTAIAAGPGIAEVASTPVRAWSGSGSEAGFGPSRQAAPAIHFLREAGAPGRLFTEYAWAGYAIHELWPQVTVFLDSRSEVYGESLLLAHGAVKRRAAAAREAIDEHDIDLVLVSYRPYPSTRKLNRGVLSVVERDPAWGLVFVDDRSVLWARGDARASLPPAFTKLAPQRFDPVDPGLVAPAYEGELRQSVERAPHSAFLRFALALSLRAQGRDDEALAELEAGWAANPNYAAGAQLAGEIQASRGQVESARAWFERALALAPDWERARESLARLPVEAR
jgi:hypothetical protein